MMKGIFFVLLLTTPMLSMADEEYRPFVEDGKVWTYFRTDPPAYMHFFSLFIQGDTIMGGKECKKLYGDHYDYHVPYEPICFLGGLYEEEGESVSG